MTQDNSTAQLVERLRDQLSTCRDSYEAPSGKIMFRVCGNDLGAILKLASQALANPATIRDTDGECPTCQGRGENYALSPHLPRSPDPVPCDDCHGTGRRDTDEDAVEADMRAYAEAAMQHGWKTAVDAAANGRLVDGWERDWFEQNPPKCARLASSTPAEPREASGYCPFCMTADPVAPAEPDEPTAEGNYDERN